MKKIVTYSFWVVFFGLGIFLLSFSNGEQESKIIGLPEIRFKVTSHMLFLTKDQVMERLVNRNLVGVDKTYNDNDITSIENYLDQMPEIKNAEVFVYVSGNWFIDIELREPIARIFNTDNSSCYIDKDGFLMPLSDSYTARVITINGNVYETNMGKNVDEIMNNDSLKTIEILDDLYAISQYVCSDEFFSAQITQVYVNQFNEFELIPRVGDQRIMFGNGDNIVGKFKKLEYFYSEGISRAGWENYDTINIMYKSKVYCSKR